MFRRIALLTSILLAAASPAGSQTDTSAAHSPLHGFPYVYYTPETDWAFGASAIVTFRPGGDRALNPSSLTLDAYYTVRRQFKCSLAPEIYLRSNRYLLAGLVGYGRIVDRYWGVGPRTGDSDSTQYVKGMFQVQARAGARFLEQLTCGVLAEFERVWMIDRKDNPLLLAGNAPGAGGATSCGAGAFLAWDSRDNIFFPSRGSYHQLEYAVFGGLLGGNASYRRALMDLRAYLPFGAHIVAVQIYGMATGGTPPFWRLALLGGDYIMRGYYLGRFRDNVTVGAQAEYRVMITGPFGAAAFAGAGGVAPGIGAFRADQVLPSCGLGLRYMLDTAEKLTLRVDAGFGRATSGIYFDIREAF
ncbi:MAG TPA: BamA/TamA family outer membrane protein [Bacteroidota bacterium]|nr:BamA/TamA family outer membrane protein [Bacteroidota bacterium]